MKLKDFTYLDSERIRSYLAQLDGKINESLTTSSEHTTGGKAGAKSKGLTKLIVDAEVQDSYLYKRSHTETSSLHHAAFDVFVNHLRKKKLVGENLTEERPFVEITCRLRVADYSKLAEQFDGMTKFIPIFERITGQPNLLAQKDKSGKSTLKLIKDISSAINILFGESRILQLIDSNGVIIAQASMDEEIIPEQSIFLSRNNQVLPNEYSVFCLKQEESTDIPLVHESSDAFNQALIDTVKSLSEIKESILPSLAIPDVIPIAIYRTIADI